MTKNGLAKFGLAQNWPNQDAQNGIGQSRSLPFILERSQQSVLQESLGSIKRSCTKDHQRVAPHAPAIQEGFRASGDRLLDSDQKQKRLDLIKNCLHSIQHALHRKEFEKELRYGSEHTQIYSAQGNTDLSQLMVIDEMIQCKVCQKNAMKVLVHMLICINRLQKKPKC